MHVDYCVCSVELSDLLGLVLNAICIENSLFARLIFYPLFCIPLLKRRMNAQAIATQAARGSQKRTIWDCTEWTSFALIRLPNLLLKKWKLYIF